MGNKQYLNMFSRAIPVTTVNEENRTIQNVITTEDPAVVFDWYRFEPIREVLLMDGMVAPTQVPLLDAHSRFSSGDVLGSSKNFRREGDSIIADTEFSSVAERQWTLVKEKHLTDTSVGYRTLDDASVVIKHGEKASVNGRDYENNYPDKLTMIVRKRWELKENSVVPIGADQRAKFRSEFVDEPIKEEQIKHPAQPSARWMQNIHSYLKLKQR